MLQRPGCSCPHLPQCLCSWRRRDKTVHGGSGKTGWGQQPTEAEGNWTAPLGMQRGNLFCWEHSILSKEKLIFHQNKNNEITVFYPENVNGKFVPSYEYRLEIFGFLRKGRSSHFHSVKNEANRVHISPWSNDWFFFLCLIHTALNMYREQTYTLDKAHRLH